MQLRTFKDLKVWQKSYLLVLEIYKVSKVFPKEERFGLTSQIRRAAVSIPSNIAEGYARSSLKQYINFLFIAYASGAELETQLMLAKDLDYFTENKFEDIIGKYYEVERMLMALIRSLEKKT
ncbi:four helix bundle protein [candidate division WOR-1 bacterium RIFOXYB2_FULL_42_35]|uniref:Four helix bundle protein n=1 Tax=candidate division WOR-1 bacterium RIFOXYC2_FULL_41_25 TaxID=1802586 RepID=A0A1F4TLX6_UNCSA|nr:MAG: four helix bundle protein [candidate division WOR-1 bacterium RIFOXYA2_FULL_41_14]OGC23843.1 MAG: four helix bundle protein [candidate division WOR-1 bacterium RIFOXYB2_FULL_42_35]OGC33718.1 MAG: four helix bundle protein [candidate division WOR-1 bacterium RIFOXYC2_FULL_41_25]OGC42661.1 MAG: four helix bundle protein [candidate division WOR-1 bacterium RIFOXYD2_FULL_41_8]